MREEEWEVCFSKCHCWQRHPKVDAPSSWADIRWSSRCAKEMCDVDSDSTRAWPKQRRPHLINASCPPRIWWLNAQRRRFHSTSLSGRKSVEVVLRDVNDGEDCQSECAIIVRSIPWRSMYAKGTCDVDSDSTQASPIRGGSSDCAFKK